MDVMEYNGIYELLGAFKEFSSILRVLRGFKVFFFIDFKEF